VGTPTPLISGIIKLAEKSEQNPAVKELEYQNP
jgi:hypothetical protein